MSRPSVFRWFFYRARGDSPAKRSLIHLVLILACIISIYPAIRVVSVSIRPGNRVLSTDLAIIPKGATFEAYGTVIRDRDFLLWVWNSLTITITTSLIGVVLASTAAYGFSAMFALVIFVILLGITVIYMRMVSFSPATAASRRARETLTVGEKP